MDPKDLYTSGFTNLLIALTSLVTAAGVVWVNVIIAKAKTKVEATADLVVAKTAEIGETTKTTLGHVNSAATEMRAIIDALRHDNDQLRVTLNENKQIAAVLAATQAALATPASAAPSVAPPAAAQQPGDASLRAIEVNTADTAAAVKDLK